MRRAAYFGRIAMRIDTEQAAALTSDMLHRQLESCGNEFADVFSLLSRSDGKYVRTRLGIACAADENGTVDERAAVRFCALELLHLATLIHDDIIDEAETRRGLPSVQAAFGRHGAVLAGDYLLTRCFALICDCDPRLVKLFSRAVSGVCRGEMRQDKNRFDRSLTVGSYLRTVSGKTAALFAAAAAAGIDCSDANRRKAAACARLGHKFGVAFQIEDDIKDFLKISDGKPTGNDLRSGIITLPAIYCLTRNAALTDYGILENIGDGIGKSHELAGKYRRKAENIADTICLPQKESISRLFDKITVAF